MAVKECPECQAQGQGNFPESVTAPVQYGKSAFKHGLNLLEVITEALQGNISVFLASITTS
ncbi:MAG: hypothetical protein Kow0049_35880 [Stanieria sp.]